MAPRLCSSTEGYRGADTALEALIPPSSTTPPVTGMSFCGAAHGSTLQLEIPPTSSSPLLQPWPSMPVPSGEDRIMESSAGTTSSLDLRFFSADSDCS
ncbi:hypothetical protein ZIOFF_021239 [Zingiber officinale]|uniref:Uncharacterized protein n=1 Tax=Zingiber officinale TaxID=94328 RepID=A0A8J5HIL3_ZINOF|nr:hypothetical protein ZIOFF_021239 [Zingiber officinale]